jgi:hypothetical protein
MAQDTPSFLALQAERFSIRIALKQFQDGCDLQVSLIQTRKRLLEIIVEQLSIITSCS